MYKMVQWLDLKTLSLVKHKFEFKVLNGSCRKHTLQASNLTLWVWLEKKFTRQVGKPEVSYFSMFNDILVTARGWHVHDIIDLGAGQPGLESVGPPVHSPTKTQNLWDCQVRARAHIVLGTTPKMSIEISNLFWSVHSIDPDWVQGLEVCEDILRRTHKLPMALNELIGTAPR